MIVRFRRRFSILAGWLVLAHGLGAQGGFAAPLPAGGLEGLLAIADPDEIRDSECASTELDTGAGAEAAWTAVVEGDLEAALARLAPSVEGDRAAARAMLAAEVWELAELELEFSDEEAGRIAEGLARDLLAALVAHPDSEPLLAAARDFLASSGWTARERLAALLNETLAASGNPELVLRFARRFEPFDWPRTPLLMLAAELGAARVDVWEALGDSEASWSGRLSLYRAAREALGESGAGAERAALLDRKILASLLEGGLAREAVDLFSALSPEEQRLVFAVEPGPEPVAAPEPFEPHPADRLRLALSAAFSLAGDPETAGEVLAGLSPGATADHAEERSRPDREARLSRIRYSSALRQLVAPDRPVDDLFPLLAEVANGGGGRVATQPLDAVLLDLLAELSLAEGYASFADFFSWEAREQLWMERQRLALPSSEEFPGWPHWSRLAPALYAQAEDRLIARETSLAELRLALPASARGDLAAQDFAQWRELQSFAAESLRLRPLPETVAVGLEPWEVEEGVTDLSAFAPRPDEIGDLLGALPSDFEALRADRSGGMWVALGSRRDPAFPGELLALRSTDGGQSWEELVLPLGAYRPVAFSALPLIGRQGLQIEVRGPAARSAARFAARFAGSEERGFYAELAWRDLLRDRDDDGLSDLLEARLGTDPDSGDSDGDGIADGRDPLPALAFGPGDPLFGALLESFLELAWQGAGAPFSPRCADHPECSERSDLGVSTVAFLVPDPDAWRGLAPGRRTLLFSPDQLSPESPRAPLALVTHLRLAEIDRSRTRAVLRWQGWSRGGYRRLSRDGDRWVVETEEAWDTFTSHCTVTRR